MYAKESDGTGAIKTITREIFKTLALNRITLVKRQIKVKVNEVMLNVEKVAEAVLVKMKQIFIAEWLPNKIRL